jgi:hypothetical protein
MAATPATQVQRIDVGSSSAGTQTGCASHRDETEQHGLMVEGISAPGGLGDGMR